MGVFDYLTVVTLVAARSVESTDSTVAIFNGWKMQNKPVKFSWAPNQAEKSSEIENFANDDFFQLKWTCSAFYNEQMLVIGGMPDGADPPTNAYEIKDWNCSCILRACVRRKVNSKQRIVVLQKPILSYHLQWPVTHVW